MARPVTDVGAGDTEWNLECLRAVGELLGLVEVYGERLFAEDQDPDFWGFHGRLRVGEVGGRDRDVIETLAIRQILLARRSSRRRSCTH